MKKQFNNAGVADVQAWLLSLNSTDLAVEILLMRTDFVAWLYVHFELSISQQTQLSELPASLLQDFADQLAAVLEQGGTFSFFKQVHTDANGQQRDRDTDKDILYQSAKKQRYSFESEQLEEVIELSIWIN